jgi:hypothetical protein
MKHDDIDRILAHDDEIVPSSGFTSAVLYAVRREVSAPKPIPFPWKRALPGVVAAIVTLILIVAEVVEQLGLGPAPSQTGASGPSVADAIAQAATNAGAQWIALALVVTVASLSLAMRLGSRRV